MPSPFLKRAIRALRHIPVFGDRRGVISIETALVGSVMAMMSIGVMDFSMAFSRKSEMSNAVRAGVQFALVRRPSIGPSAASHDSIISLETIRQAVIKSASFLESDPGVENLTASVFCQCPDSQPVTCVSDPGVPLPCDPRRTFLEITLKQDYKPIFNYPLIPQTISLQSTNSVRLN